MKQKGGLLQELLGVSTAAERRTQASLVCSLACYVATVCCVRVEASTEGTERGGLIVVAEGCVDIWATQ
jgi:hypothetical protein